MTDAAADAAPIARPPAPPPHKADFGWGSDSFVLKHPFLFAGMTYSTVTVRVPSGADIAAYLSSDDVTLRALALRLCEADDKILGAMHGADYARLLKHVGEFIAGLR